MHPATKTFFLSILALFLGLLNPPLALSDISVGINADITKAYYSRDRGDGKAARIAGNSKYIRFYPDKWVIMLYIPYDYSQTLSPEIINKSFAAVREQAKPEAYFKGKFGLLEETSVAHVELYRDFGETQIEFECDGTAPCRVSFDSEGMEVIKAGMLSNHIIKYNRVED